MPERQLVWNAPTKPQVGPGVYVCYLNRVGMTFSAGGLVWDTLIWEWI